MSIRITELKDLAGNLTDANVFYTQNYFNAEIEKGNEFFYLCSSSYVLGVRVTKRLFFRYAFFPSEPYMYKSGGEKLKDFLNQVCLYLKRECGIQWINENDTASLFMDYPDGAISIPFGSHVIDLTKSEEDLWKGVHSKHRNVIKKAEKDGVVIESGTTDKLISDYYRIDVETWERSNKKANNQYELGNFLKSLKENAILYMAYKDGEAQSGAIFYYNTQMCYYMLGANTNSPSTGSGNLLQWKAMLDMKNKGVKKYSFVGCRINEDENSKYHGIQRFKERFGGELVKGYLFKVIFCKFKYMLFQALLAIKCFINTGKIERPKDIIDQEIHKWR